MTKQTLSNPILYVFFDDTYRITAGFLCAIVLVPMVIQGGASACLYPATSWQTSILWSAGMTVRL